MRRLPVTAAVALLATGVACAPDDRPRATPTSATTTTTTAPAPTSAPARPHLRTGTAARPLTVLLVGDSVAITLETSLADALRRLGGRGLGVTRVEQGAAMGFGLTADRPSLYEGEELAATFPRYLDRWRAYVSAHRPDVVVAMLGTWDVVPRREDGRWIAPVDPGWSDRYRERLVAATDALGSRGALVTWLTEPCLDVENKPDPVNRALRDARTLLARHGATVVDFDATLCPGGRFVRTFEAPDGHLTEVRRPDGVHFADTAPRAVGPLLAELLARSWGLA